jgi:hypothetical protein
MDHVTEKKRNKHSEASRVNNHKNKRFLKDITDFSLDQRMQSDSPTAHRHNKTFSIYGAQEAIANNYGTQEKEISETK